MTQQNHDQSSIFRLFHTGYVTLFGNAEAPNILN